MTVETCSEAILVDKTSSLFQNILIRYLQFVRSYWASTLYLALVAYISFRMLSGIITHSPLNKIPSTSDISSCASKYTRTSGFSCARCSSHDVRTTWASFCSDWSRLVSSTSCVCCLGVNAETLLTSDARYNASATGISFPDFLINLKL